MTDGYLLPDDLLRSTFCMLPSIADLRSCVLVCKRWHSVVQREPSVWDLLTRSLFANFWNEADWRSLPTVRGFAQSCYNTEQMDRRNWLRSHIAEVTGNFSLDWTVDGSEKASASLRGRDLEYHADGRAVLKFSVKLSLIHDGWIQESYSSLELDLKTPSSWTIAFLRLSRLAGSNKQETWSDVCTLCSTCKKLHPSRYFAVPAAFGVSRSHQQICQLASFLLDKQ